VKTPPWLLVATGTAQTGSRLELDPVEARHATSALRLREGDRVVVTDGAGRVADATLIRAERGRAEVEIEAVAQVARPPSGLTLAMAVLAGSTMDLVIQKAVELGVERVIPVCCARSQHGLDRAAARADHWRRVGVQALKQCRRAWALDLAPPVQLRELVAGPGGSHGVVADPGGRSVRSIPVERRRCLLIGPEGGFDDGELEMLDRAGWPRIRLGCHVLRAETAAIAGVALLQGWFEDPEGDDHG
jgi:16S rRNA (uracil1498-N3)-methyltransferase